MYTLQENSENIIKKLKECPTGNEIKNLIQEVLPQWIITTASIYSDDYPHLTNNWSRLCNLLNTDKKQIIIVDYIEPNDIVTSSFAEVLTSMGFIIRKKEEYTYCSFCKKVIPSLIIYNIMKNYNIAVPKIWSNNCINCSNDDV